MIRAEIDPNRLLELPEIDRVFFISLGHLTNEINAINKLGYWAANPEQVGDEVAHGRFALNFLFSQFLTGKLFEGWRLFLSHYYGEGISKKYNALLNDTCLDELKKLKKYFDSDNNVKHIRNNFAFHNSPDKLNKAIPDVNEQLLIYLEKNDFRNSLFQFSEVLHGRAVLLSIQERTENPNFGWEDLVDELYEISALFLNVADCLMFVILEESSIELRVKDPENVELQNLRPFKEIEIPWFTDNSE